MKLSDLMDDIPIINWNAFRYNIYQWDRNRMKVWTLEEAIPDKVLEYDCTDIEFNFETNQCTIWLGRNSYGSDYSC